MSIMPKPILRSTGAKAASHRERGQVLVIFAGALFLLMMMAAVVIDVSWYWVNSLRVQRAADAAALAGAVMLPNDPGTAITLARSEALKNGYVHDPNPVKFPQVLAVQDPNPRRLDVTIKAQIGTFFMKVIGIPTLNITRKATAEFTLPVPLGSPQNYLGVGVLNIPTTSQQQVGDATDWVRYGTIPSGGVWNRPDRVDDNDNNSYGTAANNNDAQQWENFGLQSGFNNGIPNDATLVLDGLEVRLRDQLQGFGTSTDCRLQIEVSWNNGVLGSWTPVQSTPLPLSTNERLDTFGSNNSFAAWGPHAWTRADFADGKFRVRLTYLKPNCAATRTVGVDTLEVRVTYHTTQTVLNPPTPQPVISPDGQALAPQNFWAAMQSQGAPSVQGDAYMTGYTTRKSPTNPKYDPRNYYNYGIEIPNGGGQVYIFDPGFCDTSIYNPTGTGNDVNQGTGESWTLSGSNTGGNGASSAKPISAQFSLFSDNNTPYSYADDPLIATSGNTFRQRFMTDPDLGGDSGGAYGNPTDCRNQAWHNGWYKLTGGNLPTGHYRLHTTSRIYTNPQTGTLDGSDDQTDATALNAFAIYVKGTALNGKGPRVYGLGAMEAYFPLKGGQPSKFYLAQIEAIHAGKWIDIDLWDPGDTGSLRATLSILAPDGGAGTPATFYYNSSSGTTLPTNFACGPGVSGGSGPTTSVVTNTGGTSLFQGKWLRICIKLSDTYSAPVDPTYNEPGWWRINYDMQGSGVSTDLTTWQVTVRGNPDHLVIP